MDREMLKKNISEILAKYDFLKEKELDFFKPLPEFMTSIGFIKLIIDVEKAFGIEFENESFNYDQFSNLNDFLEFILDTINQD